MRIMDLIDQLEEMVKNAKSPILNKDQVILEEEELFNIIDAFKQSIPTEIQEAAWVKKDEEKILHAAQEEQDRIIRDAKDRAMAMIQENEIYMQAQKYGEQLVEEARMQAHQITEGAFGYAHDIMEKLENQLTVYYEVIQEGRDEINASLKAMSYDEYHAAQEDHQQQ